MSILGSEIKCTWSKILAGSVLDQGNTFRAYKIPSIALTRTCTTLFIRLDLSHLFNNKNVLFYVLPNMLNVDILEIK